MRVRPGIVRGFVAALVVFILVVPVGVMRSGRPEPASVGEALGELAGGSLGVGILDGFVAGGGLAREAALRLVLAAVGGVAFWLAGGIRPRHQASASRRHRCPHCRAWASVEMRDCPACGRPLSGESDG